MSTHPSVEYALMVTGTPGSSSSLSDGLSLKTSSSSYGDSIVLVVLSFSVSREGARRQSKRLGLDAAGSREGARRRSKRLGLDAEAEEELEDDSLSLEDDSLSLEDDLLSDAISS